MFHAEVCSNDSVPIECRAACARPEVSATCHVPVTISRSLVSISPISEDLASMQTSICGFQLLSMSYYCQFPLMRVLFEVGHTLCCSPDLGTCVERKHRTRHWKVGATINTQCGEQPSIQPSTAMSHGFPCPSPWPAPHCLFVHGF